MLTQLEQRARSFLRYVASRSASVPEAALAGMNDGFSIERYYVNDTYRDLTVVNRNGLAITCERGTMHHTRDNNQVFRVRTVYNFRRMSVVKPALEQMRTYARQHGVSTEDLDLLEKEIRDAVGPHYGANHFTRKITLEKTVTEQEIEASTGCFFPEEDILVVDSRYADQVFHPNSVRGRAQQQLDPILNEIKGTGVLIEIIDNDHNISSRFIHILGQTVEIRPRKDPERQSGVYVIRAEDTAGTSLKSRTTFMSFEEASEKIGLHKTREEAFSGGDAKLLITERVLEAERNLKELDGQITKRKHELEILRLDGVRQEHELKGRDREEQAEYSSRKLQRDDHYDSRSTSRRDTSESIKLSTVIIGASMTLASALAGWYFSNKKESSGMGARRLGSVVSNVVSRATDLVSSAVQTVSSIASSVCSALTSGLGRSLSWLF